MLFRAVNFPLIFLILYTSTKPWLAMAALGEEPQLLYLFFGFFLLLSQLSLPSFVSRCWAVSVVWSRISLLSSIPNFLSEPRLRVPVFPPSLTLPCYPAGSVPGGAGHGHPDPGHSRAGAGQTQPGAPELGIVWRRSLPFNSTQSLTFIKTPPKFLSFFHVINW